MIRSPSVGLTALSFISSSAEQMYGRKSSVSRIEDEGTVDASPEGAETALTGGLPVSYGLVGSRV